MVPIDFIEQNRERVTAREVARHYGVTERTVVRWRHLVGIGQPIAERMTPDEIQLAEKLLGEGCPYSEVAETIGRSVGHLRRRFPGHTGIITARQLSVFRAELEAVAA